MHGDKLTVIRMSKRLTQRPREAVLGDAGATFQRIRMTPSDIKPTIKITPFKLVLHSIVVTLSVLNSNLFFYRINLKIIVLPASMARTINILSRMLAAYTKH